MKTVAQAFQKFIEDLELREGEAREAKRQERVVAEAMKERLGPRESILSGSYGRSTAVRPLHDIDLFLIFGAASGGGGRPMKPEDLLKRVRQELEAAFPAKQAKLQNRSVNIEFQGTGISFDVVPALEDPSRPGEYQIPDRSRDTWIRSNPRRHRQAFAAANEATRTKLHPLIKMLKRWNAVVGKPVPSFLLEVMAYSAATTLPPASSYAEGMVHLFQFIQEHIEESWPDPAGLGPPVNANVGAGHLQQAQQRATETLRKARRALEEEQNRNHAAAIELWRAVLGLDFPGS